MPKGEPTRVVRLPAWLLDHLEPQAAAAECTVAELITRREGARIKAAEGVAARVTGSAPMRCDCKAPTMSKVVSNLCTTCKRMR